MQTGTNIINNLTKNLKGDLLSLPHVTLKIPNRSAGTNQFMLLTTVNVFNSIYIQHYESEISAPYVLTALYGLNPETEISFYYTLGKRPGFKYKIINT